MALPGELQRPLLLFHIEVYQHKKEPRTFLAYLYIAMTDERHVERTVQVMNLYRKHRSCSKFRLAYLFDWQAIRLDVGTGPKGFHQQGRRRRTLRLGGTPLHSISMDVIYHGNFQYPMKVGSTLPYPSSQCVAWSTGNRLGRERHQTRGCYVRNRVPRPASIQDDAFWTRNGAAVTVCSIEMQKEWRDVGYVWSSTKHWWYGMGNSPSSSSGRWWLRTGVTIEAHLHACIHLYYYNYSAG